MESGVYNYLNAYTQVQVSSDLEQALACKQRGNDFFKQQKYAEAIKCYEEAIQQCPANETNNVAIFYSNLAAAYSGMVGLHLSRN